MTIELSKIEQLAPDQASLAAAAKLKKAALWPVLACEAGGLIWGECQGSGAAPYRTVCSEADFGYHCSCPSRKFPCKHVLALMWLRADEALAFTTAPPPAWVGDWRARRRTGAAAPADAPARARLDDVAGAGAAAPAPEDPKALARAAAQRERSRADREAAIAAGLDELDTWIADALQRGLATLLSTLADRCRTIVPRLVDAKAPGLAGLVERLPADVLAVPEARRPDVLIARLATLLLVSRGYRHQDRLPEPVRADVRHMVGWPAARDALLADAGALRVSARWMVVSAFAELQADKLRRVETWLSRLDDGEPQFAVLVDFVPVSVGAVANPFAAGETFAAELAYYPSPAPLRAVIARQDGATTAGGRWPRPADDVPAAIARLADAVVARPWSRDLPFAAHGARIAVAGATLWLTDRDATTSLPLRPDPDDRALPLAGVPDLDVFGRWDGAFLSLALSETPLGRWTA